MTRKEIICDVAKKQFTCIKDENLKLSLQLAFVAGAKWADKNPSLESIWHDASEEPKIGYDIVVIDRLYQLWVIQPYNYCNECKLDSWKCYVYNYNDIQKWAYISDLLVQGDKK